MAKKKDNEIVIQKDKLFKIIGIVIASLLFILVSFAISNSASEEYSKNSTSESSSSNSGDDTLEVATKEAGEISDGERTSPNEISIDEYLDLYNGNQNSIVLLSRPTCSYCKIATPILENIIYKYNVKINYLNIDNLDDDGVAKLVSSDEYFSQGYGTPLLLVVGKEKISDKIEGLSTKSDYISFFKENKFMEE